MIRTMSLLFIGTVTCSVPSDPVLMVLAVSGRSRVSVLFVQYVGRQPEEVCDQFFVSSSHNGPLPPAFPCNLFYGCSCG